jgi:hypothetical protein
MKSIICKIIAFSFMLVFTSQIVLGYNVNNPTLEDQLGSSEKTKLVHDGAILILNQTTQKLVYDRGEEITIIPQLINIGNKTVEIAYWEPAFFLEIKNQTGVVWPPYTTVAYIPEYHGIKTLKPGEQFGARPWTTPTGPTSYPPPIILSASGNYTVLSVASLTFDTHTERIDSLEPVWSKPLQITVVPEFPLAVPIFLVSIASLIVFYRIKFR